MAVVTGEEGPTLLHRRASGAAAAAAAAEAAVAIARLAALDLPSTSASRSAGQEIYICKIVPSAVAMSSVGLALPLKLKQKKKTGVSEHPCILGGVVAEDRCARADRSGERIHVAWGWARTRSDKFASLT